MGDPLRFTLNSVEVDATGVDPNTTLLAWLRERGLTGTKEGCAEGECGACAVVLVKTGPDGKTRYTPVNSCLFMMGSAAGQEIVSVEGVAMNGQLHPVQDAMVRLGGSQCGYCTPGFIMSLFAEYYRDGRDKDGFDVASIAGNLCRCTGYRPIRDAGRSLPIVADDDARAARLREAAPKPPTLRYENATRHFIRPNTLAEAFDAMDAHPNAKLICGGTDLVVELNQRLSRYETFLSLEAVEEMLGFEDTDDALTIGASVPLSEIEERLGDRVPILAELFHLFSSRLIRNRATLGGNLATASPIGDSPPVLLALDAEVVAASKRGERTIPLHELFTGYRKTSLKAGELITRVSIPKPYPSIQKFYKVSKRVEDDISCVAAGFSLSLSDDGVVEAARLAYGGVAATPARATKAEDLLVGKPWSRETVELAKRELKKTFTPMSDQRGSAEYRSQMVTSLFEKLFFETVSSETGATS